MGLVYVLGAYALEREKAAAHRQKAVQEPRLRQRIEIELRQQGIEGRVHFAWMVDAPGAEEKQLPHRDEPCIEAIAGCELAIEGARPKVKSAAENAVVYEAAGAVEAREGEQRSVAALPASELAACVDRELAELGKTCEMAASVVAQVLLEKVCDALLIIERTLFDHARFGLETAACRAEMRIAAIVLEPREDALEQGLVQHGILIREGPR